MMPAIELPVVPRLRFLKIAPPMLPPTAPDTSWMMRLVMSMEFPLLDLGIVVVAHNGLSPCGGEHLMRFDRCAQVPNGRVARLQPNPGHPARV